MKGDSAANPFSPGGNPMSSGESGMAPAGDGNSPMPAMPPALPQSTKPRQMPGGAPPSMPGGAPGSMQPPAPGGTGGDTNVPQSSPPAEQSKAMAKVRQVRRDIVANNPDVLPQDAHHLAMQVVALQFIAAPDVMQQQRQSGGYFGDLNDPRNPYSPHHPNHPLNQDYQQGGSGGYRGYSNPASSRNPWAEHARETGYQGNSPTLVGGVQKGLDYGLNKALDWFQNRGKPKAPPQPGMRPGSAAPISRVPKPPVPDFDPSKAGPQTVVPGQRMAPQPPPVRQRVIPAPTAPEPAQQAPAPRGKPAPPAVPQKKVQDPKGHARDQRNTKDRDRRKQRSNGTGDLGDAPRGRSGRSSLPGLTGSLVYLQAGER